MTRRESAQLLRVLEAAYPQAYSGLGEEAVAARVSLWAEMFFEPYKLVCGAVKVWIASDTRGFHPAIGQIKEQIYILTHEEQSEGAAWEALHRCVMSGGQGYKDLPEGTRRVASRRQVLEWGRLDSAGIGVVQSNFLRAYRALAAGQRQREKARELAEAGAEEPLRLE